MDILKKENRIYLKVMIILCFVVSGGVGLSSNSVGIFYSYVADDLNILRGSYIIHNTIATLMLAVVALWVPKYMRSDNFRKLIIGGMLLTTIGTFLMSLANNLIEFYILGFIRGFGNAFFAFVVVSIIINYWFKKDHGFITSIIFAFSGVSGAIFSPILLNIIENYGWRTGYISMAVLYVLCGLPLLFSRFTLRPEEMGLTPYGGEIKETEKTNSKENFKVDIRLLIDIGLFASLVHLASALMQHLSPLAQFNGYSVAIMSAVVSASMIGNVLSKFVSGKVCDLKGAMFSNILFLSLSMIGALLLYSSLNSLLLIVGAFLFGSIFSETAVGLTLITGEYFGQENYSKYYPMFALIGNASYAIGCSLDGYIYDYSGSYNYVIWFSIILIILCMLFVVLGKRKAKKR